MTPTHTTATSPDRPADLGFSLLEVLLICMIAGILASIVVFSVSGMTASASLSTCAVERRIVVTATEAYRHQLETATIPATGTDDDRYERTLVDGGFLRSTSDLFDLDTDGNLTPEGDSPC